MKWTTKIPKSGDERVVTIFAWLPVYIAKDERTWEGRWLEFVTVRQRLCVSFRGHGVWCNVEFIDKEDVT